LKHTASARFWALYDSLPKQVRALADKNFQLL
jgi:predicted RNase H-like HicB family nuclease